MKTASSVDFRRLAVFLPSMESGGAERVMTVVMNGLSARGIAINLFLARATGPNLELLDPAITVTDLGANSVLRAVPRLASALRRYAPDTLLSAMTHANIAACIAAASARQRLRLVISERMSLEARDAFYVSRAERVVKAAMPYAFRRADAVVVPAAAMVPALQRHTGLPPSRFTVIPNPILPGGLADGDSGSWPLGEALQRRGRRIVLAVGRLSAVKDYPTLIEAFARLDSTLGAHLVILGEGEDRGKLSALVERLGLSDQVSLPGHCATPLRAMKSSSVYVLCSRFEGLPNVLLQALSVGARVVSTDCPTGPRELLDDGRLGALVPVGDVDAMCRALADALTATAHPPRLDPARFALDKIVETYSSTLFPL